jgi:hypothetical protein
MTEKVAAGEWLPKIRENDRINIPVNYVRGATKGSFCI